MIKLYNGDCMEIMPEIETGSVDLVLTDIPYDGVNRNSNGLRSLNKQLADILNFDLNIFCHELLRITNGTIYIFCGIDQVSLLRRFFAVNGLSTRLCIWEKTNPSPMNGQHIWLSGVECCIYAKKQKATFNEHCKNTVFKYPSGESKRHPTEKPLKLFVRLLLASSIENQTVFDPCMGSGTTGVAAKTNGRSFIGIEKDPEYFKIAERRIEQAEHQLSF